MMLLMPLVGLAIAGLAIGFAEATDHQASTVLFSGQEALGSLISGEAGWSVGALLLLVACKSVAYAFSLASFRGGLVFPAMFVGAAGGIAASYLPALSSCRRWPWGSAPCAP
jgi:H+/Cl- antiporter ClcA